MPSPPLLPRPPATTAGEPEYNDFEMIMSPKVLLPARSDGTLVSTGPQFRASGDAVLPEHVPNTATTSTTAAANSSSPSVDRGGAGPWKPAGDHHHLPSHPLAAVHHSSGSAPPRTTDADQLEWEVAAKGLDGSEAGSKRKGKKRRCACCCGCCGFCGLSKKMKWLVGTLIGMVLLAAILGAVLGGLRRARRYRDYSAGRGDLYSGSGLRDPEDTLTLTAINWTDAANDARRAIFYLFQGALMVQVYHAANESWASHNISADFNAQNLNTPSIKTSTPLAAAATPAERGADTDFAAALFYLNSDNEIRALVSHDAEQLGAWAYDEDHPSRSAANYTQLAAAADFCDSSSDTSSRRCRNAFCYAYQNRDQNVMFACGDAWDDEPTQLGGAHPGGALALVPFAGPEEEGSGDSNGTANTAMRVLHYTDTTVKLFQVWGNSSWDSDEKPILSSLESQSDNSWAAPYESLPRVVAAPVNHQNSSGSADADGLFALAFVNNYYDPEVKASLYDGAADSWMRDRTVAFDGHTANASLSEEILAGVALDHGGAFYAAALREWVIFEYAWSLDDPFTLTYVSDIWIDDPCLRAYGGCG